MVTGRKEKLTSSLEREFEADPYFVRDFLLMYRTFMTPEELWTLLEGSYPPLHTV